MAYPGGAEESAPPPQAFLDAGGAPWPEVEHVLHRRLDELAAGDALDVVAFGAEIEAHLRFWCGSNGHGLVVVHDRGEKLACRIRKLTGT